MLTARSWRGVSAGKGRENRADRVAGGHLVHAKGRGVHSAANRSIGLVVAHDLAIADGDLPFAWATLQFSICLAQTGKLFFTTAGEGESEDQGAEESHATLIAASTAVANEALLHRRCDQGAVSRKPPTLRQSTRALSGRRFEVVEHPFVEPKGSMKPHGMV